MQIVAILALCVASAVASGYGPSSGYGSSGARVSSGSSYGSSGARLASSGYGSSGTRIISSGSSPGYGHAELAPIRSSGYSSAPAVSSGYAAPALRSSAPHIPIVKYLKNDDNYGTYNLEIQTGNGINQYENGRLKNGPEGPVNVKEGSYSWTSPEGQHFTVNYVADEFGYRATGSHLPTPPPIPAEIAASLHHSSNYGGSSGYGGAVRAAAPSYGGVVRSAAPSYSGAVRSAAPSYSGAVRSAAPSYGGAVVRGSSYGGSSTSFRSGGY